MPTLRQVNVHPRTRHRLLSGLKRKRRPTSPSPSSGNGDGDGPSPHPAGAAVRYAAVRTPSALLSRDPARLSTALGVRPSDISAVRAAVACGVVCDTGIGHGRHAAEVSEGVARRCCVRVASGDDEGGDDDGGDAPPLHRGRPPPLMPGAVTALDMCARALLLKHASSSDDCIGTGSAAVDRLLAPGGAHASFDEGWGMPHPYEIPDCKASSPFRDGEWSPPGRRRGHSGGVPFGMVTEFSGPPSSGKTQLALSVAAHAALENGLGVHYVVSSGSGHSRRALSRRLFAMCRDLAAQRAASSGPGGGDRTTEEAHSLALGALDRVVVSSVPDAHSLLATLSRIDWDEEEAFRRDDGEGANNNGTLLIVDSASGCLGHHLSGDGTGPALVNQVALTLRRMARAHDGRLPESVQAGKTSRPPRRFAVVVTNGSVGRRSSDNEPIPLSVRTMISGRRFSAQNKPAMGRYWHASDVRIWMEEERPTRGDGGGADDPINFYGGASRVVGLSMADEKVISIFLQNHYGKPCKEGNTRRESEPAVGGEPAAKFCITPGGIADACRAA